MDKKDIGILKTFYNTTDNASLKKSIADKIDVMKKNKDVLK